MMKVGERMMNMERIFIVEHGIKRKDDYPPRRFLEVPVPDGPYKGQIIDREKYGEMLDDYYSLRGWDEEGVPTRAKLEELGLEYAYNRMEKLAKTAERV